MPLYMNEFGEFVTQPDYDPDANRAKAYRSCIEVKIERVKFRPHEEGYTGFATKLPEPMRCEECGVGFQPVQYNQKFCSRECQVANYNKRRRKS